MTHTAKHTPGPWSAYYNNEGLTITNASNVTIAYVDYDECEERPVAANASLIAAAPAMYEALTHALSVCEAEAELRGENDIDDYLGGAAGPVARMIRAALAQAEARA